MKKRYLILLVLATLFLGCSSLDKDKQVITEDKIQSKENSADKENTQIKKDNIKKGNIKKGNIKIEIIDEDGNSINGEVILKSEESDYINEKRGDTIEFNNIQNGLYSIQVKKEGFISTTKYLEIKGMDLIKKIKIKRRYPRITVIPTLNKEEIKATVEISKDGKVIKKDTGIFMDFKLKEGIYQLKLSGPYLITTTKYINVDNNNQDIEIKLRRGTTIKTNILDSNGNNIKGMVELKKDGRIIKSASGDKIEFNKIPKGMYEITVKKDGYLSTTKYIFAVGMILEKDFILRKSSELTVVPIYQGEKIKAEVEVSKSGKILKKGSGEEIKYQLEDGIYQVKVYGESLSSTTKYVSLDEDKKIEIPVEKVSDLKIKVVDENKQPIKGDIFLKSDDKIIALDTGSTVNFGNLKSGIYEVVVKNENYNSVSKFVNIKSKNKEISIKIRK
ncbi:MAG: hypothetical protein ACQERZ_01960 [Fusobacteriota bacterium]